MVRYLLFTSFVLSLQVQFASAQSEHEWEIERVAREVAREAVQDSLARASGHFVPKTTLSIKSQFPIQQAIALEWVTPAFISVYLGLGQFSRGYTLVALEALPSDNPANAARQEFIQDKLEGGVVLEIGSYYHFPNSRGWYAGLNVQFQGFSLPTTPQEFVEGYDLSDTDNFGGDLDELLEENNRLRDFYENLVLEPTIRPIQLGILVGKRFQSEQWPRWALHAEAAYHFNIATPTSVESPSLIGRIVITNFVEPILEDRSDTSFDGFNLPSLSLRLSCSLGKNRYRKGD